jgi:pSer/pThr/pTyr-binding forkhead associated (FHA) protein
MKLRLTIAVAPGQSIAFEHGGPVVRIGRDPDCELALQGEASTAVSRRHARIDLSRDGATLTDTGSSNGTLLNDRLIEGTVPLRIGDRIQMGYTGATLTVTELDLGTPAVGDRLRRLPPAALGLLGAGALVAVIVAVVVLLRRHGGPDDQEVKLVRGQPTAPEATERATEPASTSRDVDTKRQAPATRRGEGKKPPEPGPMNPIPIEPAGSAGRSREVGSYLTSEREVSVLLQRPGEAYPWVVLRADARVGTDTTLISLPGCRSFLSLDAGLLLTLWGDLPDFAASLPVSSPSPSVLESVAILHTPKPGFALDFTLDRGRVVLVNRKDPPGPAKVRLQFLQQVWDVDISDPQGEVGLELWTIPAEAPAGTAQAPSATGFGLFTKGRVNVHTPQGDRSLAARSRLAWVSDQPAELYAAQLKELPAWWTQTPDPKAERVQKALRSLLAWSDRLGGSNTDPTKRANLPNTSVVMAIKNQVVDVHDADNQDLGVLFLAALDELEVLLDLLKDPNPNVRGVTIAALQSWLSRGGRHGSQLAEVFERRGNSKDKAQRMVRLFGAYPNEALGRPQTYQELVGFLDDDEPLVRNLAFLHLDRLGTAGRLPEETKAISYDPTWDRDRRRPAVDQWKTLIAQGKIPLTGPRP